MQYTNKKRDFFLTYQEMLALRGRTELSKYSVHPPANISWLILYRKPLPF